MPGTPCSLATERGASWLSKPGISTVLPDFLPPSTVSFLSDPPLDVVLSEPLRIAFSNCVRVWASRLRDEDCRARIASTPLMR